MAIYRDEYPLHVPPRAPVQLEPPQLEIEDSPADITNAACPSCGIPMEDYFIDGLLKCDDCGLTWNVHTKMARAIRRYL